MFGVEASRLGTVDITRSVMSTLQTIPVTLMWLRLNHAWKRFRPTSSPSVAGVVFALAGHPRWFIIVIAKCRGHGKRKALGSALITSEFQGKPDSK
jgi:hypothetical protein